MTTGHTGPRKLFRPDDLHISTQLWHEGQESRDEGAVVFAAMSGTDVAAYSRERPGMSAFRIGDVVYHTHPTYSRGLDVLWGMYRWLDRAPGDATRRTSGGAATTSTTNTE